MPVFPLARCCAAPTTMLLHDRTSSSWHSIACLRWSCFCQPAKYCIALSMSLFDSADNRSSSSTSSSTSFKNSVSPWLYNPYISIPVTCGSVLGLSLFYRRFFRRIPSAEFITPRTISRRKAIRGYVTSVGDGDGFRLYHTPGILLLPRLWKVPRDKKQLKDQTISIRLAGVDAPEVGRQADIAWSIRSGATGRVERLTHYRWSTSTATACSLRETSPAIRCGGSGLSHKYAAQSPRQGRHARQGPLRSDCGFMLSTYALLGSC